MCGAEVVLEVCVGGFETAHLEERTTTVEDIVSQGEVDVNHTGVFVEQARVTLVQTDYAVAFVEESLGNTADYGVHTGSGSTTGENCNCFFHSVFVFVMVFVSLLQVHIRPKIM